MNAQVFTHVTADTARTLDSMRAALADAIVERHYSLRPELEARHGERGRQNCREDAAHHLTYLARSLAASEPVLFREHIAWAKVMLAGRGVATRDLAESLHVTAEVLRERLPTVHAVAACHYLDAVSAELPEMAATLQSCFAPEQPLAELARSYLAALLACERQKATRLILDAVEAGAPIKQVYIHVFQRSQQEIGRLWQVNQITVAQEHYCTAATQMIMSQLYPRIFAAPRIGRSFLGTSVSGDLHEVGIRIIADFFEMDGWDTIFLGANVPGPDLIRTLQDRKPDVLGISATLTPHVAAVARTIAEVRGAPGCSDMKIIVGGYPFLVAPALWREIGADGTSPDAQGVVELCSRLLQS